MDIAGIINGHMQLYSHFVKNISQFPIGVDRLSYSVAVSTGVGRASRVQLLTVPRRLGLVTYLE